MTFSIAKVCVGVLLLAFAATSQGKAIIKRSEILEKAEGRQLFILTGFFLYL